jgi:hypothetical protein
MWFSRSSLTFQTNVSPSGSKSNPGKKPAVGGKKTITLKMEAAHSSKMSLSTHKPTWYNNPGNHNHCHENLKI